MNPAGPIPSGNTTSVEVLMWVGALIVAVLILGIIILLIRRKLFTRDESSATGVLDELRRMHNTGQMTTAEYEAARKSFTARIAAKMPDSPAPRRAAAAPARQPETGELRARPGFDLTGAPLPQPPAKPGPYDRKPSSD